MKKKKFTINKKVEDVNKMIKGIMRDVFGYYNLVNKMEIKNKETIYYPGKNIYGCDALTDISVKIRKVNNSNTCIVLEDAEYLDKTNWRRPAFDKTWNMCIDIFSKL